MGLFLVGLVSAGGGLGGRGLTGWGVVGRRGWSGLGDEFFAEVGEVGVELFGEGGGGGGEDGAGAG